MVRGIGGRFYTFKDGVVSGNRIQFRTIAASGGQTAETKWTIELVDENTVTLIRAPLEIALVGTNVLDLIAILGTARVGAVVQPAPATVPVTPQAPANASVRGVVQDRSRANIPGVTVTATNLDTRERLATMTNEAGVYTFPNLTRGRYTLFASLPGFNTETFSDLTIGGTPVVRDFTLDVAQPVESCKPNGMVWCVVLHRGK